MATRFRCTYADGFQLDTTWRKRWIPWFSDNLALGSTVFAKHYTAIMVDPVTYAPTKRHESQHCRDYHDLGWWWMLTHPAERETRAKAQEQASFPTFRVIQ